MLVFIGLLVLIIVVLIRVGCLIVQYGGDHTQYVLWTVRVPNKKILFLVLVKFLVLDTSELFVDACCLL